MQATSRRVFVYNMDIETSKTNARLPTASELTAIWDRRRRAGRGHVDIGSGDITVTLGDVVIDSTNQIASFLFRHSDKGAAESVYSDIRAGVFRPNAKANTEGGETGAHLFLSLAPEVNLVDRYTCIVEKVPYLDYNLMRRVLNKIIHDEYDEVANSFEYDNLAGQRTREGLIRKDRCLPRIEFEGQPSANLAADIEDGHLNAITLVKAENNASVGGVPFLTKESSTLKLSIDQGNMPRNIWGSVRRALRAEAPQYPVAHVSVTPPGTTRSISIKVDASTGAPLGDLYTKSHDIIGISPPLRHSSDSVVSHFVRLIEPILIDERRI